MATITSPFLLSINNYTTAKRYSFQPIKSYLYGIKYYITFHAVFSLVGEFIGFSATLSPDGTSALLGTGF